MAITSTTRRGFALLIAVIIMSVMLSFGLALGALSYKQQILASDAVESQYAFYAADSALECALYSDQRLNSFAYPASDPGGAPAFTCEGSGPVSSSESYTPSAQSPTTHSWNVWYRIGLDANTHCADITVYKDSTGATSIYSLGYDVSCGVVGATGGARVVSRGLGSSYQ